MKKNIAKRLRHNEKAADQCKDELSTKITGEDRRELMELQYQVDVFIVCICIYLCIYIYIYIYVHIYIYMYLCVCMYI
jgi:hypothetical protein